MQTMDMALPTTPKKSLQSIGLNGTVTQFCLALSSRGFVSQLNLLASKYMS